MSRISDSHFELVPFDELVDQAEHLLDCLGFASLVSGEMEQHEDPETLPHEFQLALEEGS